MVLCVLFLSFVSVSWPWTCLSSDLTLQFLSAPLVSSNFFYKHLDGDVRSIMDKYLNRKARCNGHQNEMDDIRTNNDRPIMNKM